MPLTTGFNHVGTLAGTQEVGEIQALGGLLSLFFRDPDGMELEVCCPAGR